MTPHGGYRVRSGTWNRVRGCDGGGVVWCSRMASRRWADVTLAAHRQGPTPELIRT
jgi:hypothetical protein